MNRLGLVTALLALACSTAPGPTPTVEPTLPPSPTATAAASPTALPSPTAAPSPTLPPIVDGPLPEGVAAALQGVLNGYVVEHGLAPSISAAVLVPGVGAWYGAVGFADRDPGAEIEATPDTVYAVGSITKTFVAALILRLVEEGFLGLDDPAADHLGPLSGSKSNGATIRQLLGHRSGIDDYTEPAFSMDRLWSPAELVDMIGQPHFAPGTQFEYSNSNYLLLGLIAEVVTGGPLGELLHEYLLDRFDLSRTYFCASEPAIEPLAHPHVLRDGVLRDAYDGSGQLPFANSASGSRGAGAMASTTSDLGRWLYLLYAGNVLRPETKAQMLDFSASTDYGLGVMRLVVPSATEVIGHLGRIQGFVSAAFYARDSGVVVIILSNSEELDLEGALNRLFAAAL